MGAPAQVIVGILGLSFGAHIDRLQESAGEDDGTDEFLHRPFILHEGRGKVFKQLGVLGQRGADAVVAGGFDQAAADEFGPDAIGHHAGGERVRLARDGVGHVETTTAFGEFLDLAIGEDGRELTRDGLAWTGRATAKENDTFDCRGFIQKNHRVGRTLRARGLVAGDLNLEVGTRVTVGDIVSGNERGRRHHGRPSRMENQVTPGLPLRASGVIGLTGFGKKGGVGRGQFGELGRRLGLQAAAQERIGELCWLGKKGGEALREVRVGHAL